tara:strand:+ start:255 stop:2525 length:2271 start_codon:yes stop_codon:yes gene_type:complete
MAKKEKLVTHVQNLFNSAKTTSRTQWEHINQKGFDFANDNQLSEEEKRSLEEQGMPTFTINRIIPVVEMLNFYATSQTPRWQAVGAQGDDTDIAALFADIADYIWYNSHGEVLYSNAINDCITKSIGYLMVTVDPDADQGMGEVILTQPEPFDIYVDEKSRDVLFRDASYIMIRKVLPKSHLVNKFPNFKRKIMNAESFDTSFLAYSEKATDIDQKDFDYKDVNVGSSIHDDEKDRLIEYFELYEKEKIDYVNVFFRVIPDEVAQEEIVARAQVEVQKMEAEMTVAFKEKALQMQQAVEAGEMLPERMQLELQKEQEMMTNQIKSFEIEVTNRLQEESQQVENQVFSKKEFDLFISKDPEFEARVVDAIPFKQDKIKICRVVGDKKLDENYLPLTEYPIIPFHYKWTGTPFPVSAVSPLIGKQRELNKAHQLMVHNASLGSSLRYMYEEGSIDTDHWERYSSAPGALLPVRGGFEAPTPVTPFQLNNAFFSLVNAGKGDMEYLAGIYSSMQGDAGVTGDMPYRGMLAMDEYGTRRIKYWLKNSIEPALRQVGEVVKQLSQAVYTANKIFTVVQPNEITQEKQVEINIPIYNDFGQIIDKYYDYKSAKFDVRIIGGSTLPVNRWAYLEELKQLMQLGVVDDIAILEQADIKNKDKIVQRKSQYAQMQSQIEQLSNQVKDLQGTNETLERQVVQANIKSRAIQGDAEIQKKVASSKANIYKEELEAKAQHQLHRKVLEKDLQVRQDKIKESVARDTKD